MITVVIDNISQLFFITTTWLLSCDVARLAQCLWSIVIVPTQITEISMEDNFTDSFGHGHMIIIFLCLGRFRIGNVYASHSDYCIINGSEITGPIVDWYLGSNQLVWVVKLLFRLDLACQTSLLFSFFMTGWLLALLLFTKLLSKKWWAFWLLRLLPIVLTKLRLNYRFVRIFSHKMRSLPRLLLLLWWLL